VGRLRLLAVGPIPGRLVQTASDARGVGHRQLRGDTGAGHDPALDLAQQAPPEPFAAVLGRDPHREDVKELTLVLVPIGADDSHRLRTP